VREEEEGDENEDEELVELRVLWARRQLPPGSSGEDVCVCVCVCVCARVYVCADAHYVLSSIVCVCGVYINSGLWHNRLSHLQISKKISKAQKNLLRTSS
jgi:hypothetical protein